MTELDINICFDFICDIAKRAGKVFKIIILNIIFKYNIDYLIIIIIIIIIIQLY